MSQRSNATKKDSPWNSLEVAKILVSTSTTLAIFIVGWWLQSQQSELAVERQKAMATQALESARYTKFLEKRTELWDRMAPLLARMNWLMNNEQRTPANVVEVRQLNRQASELLVAYQLYFSAGFVTAFEGYDDVTLRVLDGYAPWGDPTREIWDRYKCLRRAAARDIGIPVDQEVAGWERSIAQRGWTYCR
jgi:hypothetical protein